MTTQTRQHNIGMLLWLGAIAVVMLCFGLFAMRPLYGVWCRVLGTQSTTSASSPVLVGNGRFIKAYFEAVNFDDLPVRFWPDAAEQPVEVGGEASNVYHFENLSDQPVHFRPIHQLSPAAASGDFSMRVCFCFTNQTVGPRETKSFPVIYRFAPTLDPRTTVVTLRYGLFSIDPTKAPDPAELKRQEERIGAGIVSPGTSATTPSLPKVAP